jgi:hypothetical protein
VQISDTSVTKKEKKKEERVWLLIWREAVRMLVVEWRLKLRGGQGASVN